MKHISYQLCAHCASSKLLMPLITCFALVSGSLCSISSAIAGEVAVHDGRSLHEALKNAKPGDDIVLYPGRYQGIKTQSPEGRWHSYYSHRSGTETAPITLRSYSQDDIQILSGTSVSTAGYVFYLTGDHWLIKDLQFHTGQKGIMLDSSDNNTLDNIAVYNVRDEGVHFRQSSSNNILSNCHIYNTGRLKPGFGEAVYVGTHEGDVVGDNSNANRIGGCEFGPGITAEAIDIKAGTVDTIVEHNRMYGDGVSGVNYADSFIDVKGDRVIIRNNDMHWLNNSHITHAIHILRRDHQKSNIYQNSVTLDRDREFLKIGQGTVHALNNQLNYSGPMFRTYGQGDINDDLDENLPAPFAYTGFQNSILPVTEREECLRVSRGKKTEFDGNVFSCIDIPVELSGRLLQVWDSNDYTQCNFRGDVVSIASGLKWTISANYAGTRTLKGTRVSIVPTNGCPYLVVRWL